MEVYGWGRFPKALAEIVEPADVDSLARFVKSLNPESAAIARGAGKSYGDSALADIVLCSRYLDNFIALDEDTGTIRCGAGVNLESLLKLCLPRGWFPPVLPGTRFVSIGGAIAADIHGKNHHQDGCFSAHVAELSLLLASGEIVSCSAQHNAELFAATCGGMGLTGVIVDATLRLLKVSSIFINRRTLIAHNLEQCFELLESNHASKYSVAWLDCLAQGAALGRSLVYLGDHVVDAGNTALACRSRMGVGVPFDTPGFLLNKYSVRLFNSALFCLLKQQKQSKQAARVHYDKYFFPLDHIGNWNRLYGSKGFVQYQFVIPEAEAFAGIAEVLTRVSASGKGSFLSVLKKFGAANSNLLSFPVAGYTLALDFKVENNLFSLLDELDEIIMARGGRIYLAKDARMKAAVFKTSYPNWEQFAAIKKMVDPANVFRSLQSERLGLS